MRVFAPLLLLILSCGVTAPSTSGLDSGTDAGAGLDAGVTTDAGLPELRLVVLMNTSQSWAVTDPNGSRASALITLLNAQPATSTSVAVLSFMGSSTIDLTISGLSNFQSLEELNDSGRARLASRLMLTGSSDAGEALDFAAPLHEARTIIENELATHPGARFRVLLVSDGAPHSQDATLLCSDLVSGLSTLGDVRLSTARINQAQIPTCSGAVTIDTCSIQPTVTGCAQAEAAADLFLLERLAALGQGSFHDFKAAEPVDFSYAVRP